jgi:hypothetical protein
VTDAAAHLRAIREQWGDLLAAIARPPVQEWPPRQPSVQHLTEAPEDAPAVGRLPLVLRQHPAPVNLDALDAAIGIETALFDLADRIAAAIQRPARMVPVPTLTRSGRPTTRASADRDDHTDPARWHFPTNRDIGGRADARPGSRVLGLHWAACWIEDRLAQPEPTDLHGVVRGVLRDHAEKAALVCHCDLQRALGRDGRTTVLADPCPWCHGTLTVRTTSGDPAEARITCSTGPTCTAPAPYDSEARRTWHGRDLVQLYGALTAARSKETAA